MIKSAWEHTGGYRRWMVLRHRVLSCAGAIAVCFLLATAGALAARNATAHAAVYQPSYEENEGVVPAQANGRTGGYAADEPAGRPAVRGETQAAAGSSWQCPLSLTVLLCLACLIVGFTVALMMVSADKKL